MFAGSQGGIDATMASLMRSAAVPCEGEFTAVRSANPRAHWDATAVYIRDGPLASKSVLVTPVCRTSALVASMKRATPS